MRTITALGLTALLLGGAISMLAESDAKAQWVAGCQDIPEDGNFQGNIEACEVCLPVIVEHVYDQPAPE